MGIPIEQSNPEYAAGQVEVNIRYDSALLADRVVMFRALVKQLAARHGYDATFMASPSTESGNGFTSIIHSGQVRPTSCRWPTHE